MQPSSTFVNETPFVKPVLKIPSVFSEDKGSLCMQFDCWSCIVLMKTTIFFVQSNHQISYTQFKLGTQSLPRI